jgi:hypothetical protein
MTFQMMKGGTTTYTFEPKRVLLESRMLGDMIKINLLRNFSTKNMTVLFETMDKKYSVTGNEYQLNDQNNVNLVKNAKFIFNKIKTKKILGYHCYYFKILNELTPEKILEGYLTEKIKTPSTFIENYEKLSLPGAVMELTNRNSISSVTQKAKSFSISVNSAKFNLDSTGFTPMSIEQFKAAIGKGLNF